jgi:NAD(P)-dependent dehydrogenase (short-subunit alcohol dehydrogenase family)
MERLKGKVAVITGGSSGIGKACVELFIKEGSSVVIADIQDEKGQKLADEMGNKAIFQHTNVIKEADVKSAIDLAVKTFGKLDIIVNNAGFAGSNGDITQIPSDGFDITMGVLLKGVFLGIKHAIPVMRKRGGSIINTASIAGLRTGFAGHIYSCCKSAVIQLTKTVAQEVGVHNIRVNAICPGAIPTGIFTSTLPIEENMKEQITSAIKQRFADFQPIKRSGTPEDVAKAALWLASDEANFISGIHLLVDGGLSCRTLGLLDQENGPLDAVFKGLLGTEDDDKVREIMNEEIQKRYK